MNYLEDAIKFLVEAPTPLLVVIGCIVIGYILRFVPAFPNNGIPLVVIIMGAMLYALMAPPPDALLTHRGWLLRNILVGLALGCLAWLVHNQALSRLEDWGKGIMKTKDEPPPASPPK
jgi:hypothetical protein